MACVILLERTVKRLDGLARLAAQAGWAERPRGDRAESSGVEARGLNSWEAFVARFDDGVLAAARQALEPLTERLPDEAARERRGYLYQSHPPELNRLPPGFGLDELIAGWS